MLELKNVSKFYYSKGIVTSGFTKVNLELKPGEFVAITGESGSGKSTLLNVLSGLDSYEEGEMYIEGEETSAYSELEWEKYRRKYISNIFQSFNLVSSYTVYQNVELALLLSGYKGKEKKKKILSVLEKVGLLEYKNQKASRLSGGQKQRVAIARALVRDTPIIVADEPTGNLDSESAANVVEMLSRVATDKLVIVVTHNYEQVEPYVTRKISMHDGQVTEDIQLRDLRLSRPEEEREEKPEHEKGVYESEIRRVSFFQRYRLGVRNAFNIVPKFLLLLVVFLFVCIATSGYYVANLAARDSEYDYSYNYYFNNTDDERIIINKTDHSPISKAEIEKLRTLDNVKEVVEQDLMLDSTIFLEGMNFWLDGEGYSLDSFTGELIAGSLPTGDHEVVIAMASEHYLNNEETIRQILEDEFRVSNGDGNSDQSSFTVKVTGVALQESGQDRYRMAFYGPKAFVQYLGTMVNMNHSTIQMTFEEQMVESTPWSYQFMMIPSEKIKPGEAMVSTDVNYMFASGIAKYKTFDVHVENMYYQSDKTFKITDTYNKWTFKDKVGFEQEEYDWKNGVILVNVEDYESFFVTDTFQSSVFVEDAARADETAETLKTMGYVPFVIKNTKVNMLDFFEKILHVLTGAGSVILLVATFFIAYFVVRLIMRSRNTYFTTVRILGATKGDCYHLLFIDMSTVLTVAYALFLGAILGQKFGFWHLEFLEDYFQYMTPVHYVILYGILLLMSLGIATRYARKLFKQSAMKTYKEA